MRLDEATELMEWVKAIEETDADRYPLELGDMGKELASRVRGFVERDAELGGWYTDLMAALGEDEVDVLCGPEPAGAGDLDELETDARDGSDSQEASHAENTVRSHGGRAI